MGEMLNISNVTKEPLREDDPQGGRAKYPFPTMEVGDTFYIYRREGRNQHNRAYAIRRYWEARLPGRKWVVRAVSVGLRVQRVE